MLPLEIAANSAHMQTESVQMKNAFLAKSSGSQWLQRSFIRSLAWIRETQETK